MIYRLRISSFLACTSGFTSFYLLLLDKVIYAMLKAAFMTLYLDISLNNLVKFNVAHESYMSSANIIYFLNYANLLSLYRDQKSAQAF